jgi:hypothetical protein
MPKTAFQIINSISAAQLDELTIKLVNRTGHIVTHAAAQPRGPYTRFETDAMFAAVVDVLRDEPYAIDVVGPDGERWENPNPPTTEIP